MINDGKLKITHIIKTKSLYSDGRLLKWINSLRTHNILSNVFMLEDDNQKRALNLDHVSCQSTFLISRKFFSKRKGYVFKVPEFTLKSLKHIRKLDADILVFHDMQHYLTLYMLLFLKSFRKNKRIIWDLHELPHEVFFKSSITKRILKSILESVDMLVYTNHERRRYMQEKLNYKEKEYAILNNFPDVDYITNEKSVMPSSLSNLRANKPYILWLGVASSGRNFKSFISAFKNLERDFNLVMLGNVENEFNGTIEEYKRLKIVYNDFVKQNEIISYIDNASFSVVLYNDKSPNNFYCEPNRLYQLICRDIPIVVGHNPTMKNIVDKTKSGIILDDDGSDITKLTMAMSDISNNIGLYKENMKKLDKKEMFSWENQFNILANKIKSL